MLVRRVGAGQSASQQGAIRKIKFMKLEIHEKYFQLSSLWVCELKFALILQIRVKHSVGLNTRLQRLAFSYFFSIIVFLFFIF